MERNYGDNLKKALENKHMSVKELARRTGISPTTLYSVIKRNSAVRFDHALRISSVLDVDISQICKTNPYTEDGTEVLPGLLPNYFGLTDKLNRKTYIENRLGKVLMLVDYEDMPKVDELIADFIQMDDEGRKLLFGMLESLKMTHTDRERKKKLAGVLDKGEKLHLNLKD